MDKLKLWFMGIIVKKYALGPLVEAYKFTKGYKTQIALALSVIVYIAETFGFITHELALQLYAVLGGAGGLSFVQKLKGYQDKVEKIAKEVKDAADKSEKK